MTVEEVECIAACDLAPVLQVNYEFHGPLTGERATTSSTSTSRGSAWRAPSPVHRFGRAGEPVEAEQLSSMVEETRIITKFLHERPDDSWTIDAALANGAYDGLRKALGMTPDEIVTEVTTSGLRGRGGAGLRHRPEVVVPAEGRVPALPRGERRRR